MKDYLQRILRDRNDEEAWESIFLDNKALLSAIVKKYIFNINDRQDVQQEILIKLYKNIHSYDCSRNFQAWLYILSKRICFDWIKKNSGYGGKSEEGELEIIIKIIYDDTVQGISDRSDTIDFTEQIIIQQAINHALSTVEDREQVLAFKLQYIEGLKLDEIADILHKPASTIHNWPTRVRDKIKPILSDLLEKKPKCVKYK